MTLVCTCPEPDAAQRIATTLVDQRVAACVNIIPESRSIYHWNGHTYDEPQTVLTIKTRSTLFAAVQAVVCELHPDAVPELVALPVVDGHRAYLDWVREQTR